jgi:predicted amidohydrolase
MPRPIKVAAAQSGPVDKNVSRADVVERLITQMQHAHREGCQLIVYTECALTAFFAHWWIDDERELDRWFEREMPGPDTQPLFAEAARLGIGFSLGYAELATVDGQTRRFNTSILVGQDGRIIGKHRKIHLPGHHEHRPHNPFQNLEKRYFDVGDLGFQTWDAFGGTLGMSICNDRRWPESYRVLGLRGAEMILIGYNTPDNIPEYPELDRLVGFHHELCMQAGANENAAWVVAVGKGGVEEGVSQIGLTSIIAPSGEIVAQRTTLDDELVIHECDLDESTRYRGLLDLEHNRRPEFYGPIVEQVDQRE